MVSIVGTLGFSLTCKIGTYFWGTVVDPATTPDTVYLGGVEHERFFTVTAGAISFTLPQTETDNVSVHFSIYLLDGSSNIIRPAIEEFDAIVLNQSSIEWSNLIPTGVVNSQLDTAALRIARLIANDPDLASKVAGAPYPRGVYSNSTTYNYGDLVSYFGRNYISKSITGLVGILPTDDTKWYELLIPLPDELAVIAVADNTPYSSGWNGSLLATSQNTVYDKVSVIDSDLATAISNISSLTTNKANLSGAAFTGTVTVLNQTLGDNSYNAANTRYVDAGLALKADASSVAASLGLKANLANPNFSGTATVPDQSAGNNSSTIANTRYVDTGLALKANLASPTFTGTVTIPTPSALDNTTKAASTAFVNGAIATSFGWNSLSVVGTYTAVVNVQYSKHPSGIVFMRGNVSSTVINDNTTICTLPTGNRPSVALLFAVPCNTGGAGGITTIARVSVDTDGQVRFAGNITSGGTTITLLRLDLSFNVA